MIPNCYLWEHWKSLTWGGLTMTAMGILGIYRNTAGNKGNRYLGGLALASMGTLGIYRTTYGNKGNR